MRFTDRHSPGLKPGNYTITVRQSIEGISQKPFEAQRHISVLGPRFTLDPREIQELFPAPGSLGDHSNVLPHVILKRSTLPWERRGNTADPAVPWLALLLFDEQENIRETSCTLSSLKTQALTFLPVERGDHDDDQVVVIDVPKSLLEHIIPTAEELKYLAHVRERQGDEDGAVLLGNRLPKPGRVSVVHLVSLERRYASDVFDYRGADSIRLVSLRSWRFACVSAKRSFKGALTHLNHQLLFHFPPQVTDPLVRKLNAREIPGEIRAACAASASPLTPQATIAEQAADHWWITDGRKRYFISQESIGQGKKVLYVYALDPDGSSTLRLPPLAGNNEVAKAAEIYLKRGCVPLPHATRQGSKAVSWYHGPLTPGTNKSTEDILMRHDNALPIRSADALVRYNTEDGMLDVSYAAAWELGRLLTLKNTQVAVALFNWKRAHAHDEQLKMAEGVLAHLPYQPARTDLDIPAIVTAWFADLALLHGVPFTYLVPDERTLPLETIRFFCVDWQWMECLLDGAFSVGRVMPIDHARDRKHVTGAARHLLQRPHDIITGVLIRSDVVAGWPGLLVDGYDGGPGAKPLRQLRVERLSKNVLLCLFAGKVTMVDVHQKPESLHSGFSRAESLDNGTDYYKEKAGPLPWKSKDQRVVAIRTLADSFRKTAGVPEGSYHSATFALDMIEGVERVRFRMGGVL